MTVTDSWPMVDSSTTAKQTANHLRKLVEGSKDVFETEESNLPVINMSIGDPTIFGNFKTHPLVLEATIEQFQSYKYNGYNNSTGLTSARAAIAKEYSEPEHSVNFTQNDVFVTCGCSGAVEISISSLCSPGDNILIPKPGFPLYKSCAESRGVAYKQYNLLPSEGWKVDLNNLESLIDNRTKAILVNNPSNPCGSNWDKQHIQEILDICDRHKIPLISDEIYNGLIFSGETFFSAASISKRVPILTLGGLAKRYMMPGWRVGWITVHDPLHVMTTVKEGITELCGLLLGPSAPIQAAIPKIFEGTFNAEYTKQNCDQLEANANAIFQGISTIRGLTPILPRGAMYLMVLVDPSLFDQHLSSGIEIFKNLMHEEHVQILPGEAFDFMNSFRIVITPPKDKLVEAISRINTFCNRHYI
ncbi:Tyrosine aminotransferase [Smittium mucronatum]|uniref:Tyrosine aminotransferase n=1 Tax=Smittium mucronatum TaxID=133383 RepID=A0A1R0H3E3_9FUNG|nr:Tyrosine aminotransferase [Smittium mucronatum]